MCIRDRDNFGQFSTTVSFTLENNQRATVTITNTDGYPSECIVYIDGSGSYCTSVGNSVSITSPGAHTVQLGDSYGDGGNAASIVIEDSTTATPLQALLELF